MAHSVAKQSRRAARSRDNELVRKMEKQTKFCNKCQTDKDINAFGVANTRKSGRHPTCKECVNKRARKRYVDKAEEIIEYQKDWVMSNRDRRKLITKRWRDKHPAQTMWRGAQSRAKKENLPFTITIDDICIPRYCPVLGIELVKGTKVMQDASPSLDKIVPSLGYIPGNISVISQRANWLKRDATVDEIENLVKWMRLQLEATEDIAA